MPCSPDFRNAPFGPGVLLALLVVTSCLAPATAASTNVTFMDQTLTDHAGDVVPVTLSTSPGANTTLSITGPNVSQSLVVTDDGDGEIRLRFNTYDGSWHTIAAGDSVTITSESTTWPLESGRYHLSAAGTQANATLTLREPGLHRLGAFIGTGTYHSVRAVEQAKAEGSLSMAPSLTSNATVVVQLDVTGLAGAVAATDGENLTARFASLLTGERAEFSFEQINPSPERRPKELVFGPGVHVLAAEDRYYVVIELAEARFSREKPVTYQEGDRFRTAFTLTAESPLTEAKSEFVSALVGNAQATVATAPDGQLRLRPASNQTVTGTTTIGRGWNVSIILQAHDNHATASDESFARQSKVRLGRQRSDDEFGSAFTATFDLSGVPPGTNVTVDVRRNNRSLLDQPLISRVSPVTATVRAGNPTRSSNFTAIPTTVSLSRGGFVVLHRKSADGPVVGVSAYLPPGDNSPLVYVSEQLPDSTTVVAVVHRDANHNHWFDGPQIDPPFEHAADARMPPTRTPHVTMTGSETTTNTAPGFGVIAALGALFALVSRLRR